MACPFSHKVFQEYLTHGRQHAHPQGCKKMGNTWSLFGISGWGDRWEGNSIWQAQTWRRWSHCKIRGKVENRDHSGKGRSGKVLQRCSPAGSSKWRMQHQEEKRGGRICWAERTAYASDNQHQSTWPLWNRESWDKAKRLEHQNNDGGEYERENSFL